ncbi:MAG: phosphatidate cytidylyltransferase [Clostridia bacterium]
MVKRTVTGIVMGGALFLILWLTSFSQTVFDIAVLVFCILATYEMYSATKRAKTKIKDKNGYNISIISLIIAVVIIYPMTYFYGYTGILLTIVLAIFIAFIEFVFDDKKMFEDFTTNVLIIFYPIAILGLVFALGKFYGIIPCVLAIGISTFSDATAYFVGASIGKKKIFPKISPKKTYAGCIGGLFGGAIGGVLVYLIFEMWHFPSNIMFTFGSLVNGNVGQTILIYAVIGFVIAIFSEIGDLAASRIKREVGIKDYGWILGSHGGAMDRIDSIMFTIICVTFIMFVINIIG